MYIKLISKQTINNKQMYSPRMYKFRDSYTHDVSAPWCKLNVVCYRR